MTNATLYEYEDHWPTELGAVSVADGTVTFRGHDLLNALEDLSWMDLLMYGITGRRFSATQLELFQGLWKISASYPEPRIWNNRVAALGGSARSTPGLSLAAAVAVTDATIYGQRPMIGVFDFLRRARAARDSGELLKEFVARELKIYRGIPGYGRPLRSVDERLAPAERLARRLGLWGCTHPVGLRDRGHPQKPSHGYECGCYRRRAMRRPGTVTFGVLPADSARFHRWPDSLRIRRRPPSGRRPVSTSLRSAALQRTSAS